MLLHWHMSTGGLVQGALVYRSTWGLLHWTLSTEAASTRPCPWGRGLGRRVYMKPRPQDFVHRSCVQRAVSMALSEREKENFLRPKGKKQVKNGPTLVPSSSLKRTACLLSQTSSLPARTAVTRSRPKLAQTRSQKYYNNPGGTTTQGESRAEGTTHQGERGGG